MNTWYAFNQTGNSDEAELSIYDAIGAYGVTAQKFCADLKSVSAKQINIRINSPGGEAFEATAIHNALREHPARVVVHIDGLAASAGSVIAMSGDEVRMANNAYVMIHEAHGGVMGEAEELRRYAGVLDKINDNIAATYSRKSGKKREHYRTLMAAETWFTAAEAKAEGLVDTVYAPEPKREKKARAAFDFKVYNQAKIPDAVKTQWAVSVLDVNDTIVAGGAPPKQTNQPDPRAATEVAAAVAEVPLQETTAMAETSNASTAQAPAAVASGIDQGAVQPVPNTVQALNAQTIEVTKRQGIAEGRRAEREDSKTRLRDLIAAAPGKPDIAIRAFLSDETAASVKLAFDAAAEADRNANARIAAIELENARLIALAANGGYPNGIGMSVTNGDESDKMLVPAGTDPDTQAKMEWDSNFQNCRNSGATEKQYKLARVAALNGMARVFRPAGVVVTHG